MKSTKRNNTYYLISKNVKTQVAGWPPLVFVYDLYIDIFYVIRKFVDDIIINIFKQVYALRLITI